MRVALLRSYFAAVALGIALAGCATAPVEETRAFDKAVTAIKSAGDVLLDTVAAAERRTHVARVKQQRGRYAFTVADAPYFATIGDPRNVAAYRHSLEVVKQYSSLLLSLAQGDNIDKAHADLLSIASNLAAAASATQLVPAVQALAPFIDQALKAYTVAEARRLAIEGIPAVRDLLAAFRDHAGDMFNAILADRALSNATPASIEADRVMVANFIVLLESLQTTLDQLALAYERPSSPATLAMLVDASAKLNADVEAARKTYAVLRGR